MARCPHTDPHATSVLARPPRTGLFFTVTNGALLVVLVVGFSPTLFLRPFFGVRQIPGYFFVHGAILTAWFVLLVVQSWLIAGGRRHAHRRLGVAGAWLAVLVVLNCIPVNLRAIPRLNALGIDRAFNARVHLGNAISLLFFTGLVAVGVWRRRQPDVHKRAMLIATLAIFGPVLARFELYWGIGLPLYPDLFLMAAIMVGYDVCSRGRVHRMTTWGVGLYLTARLVLAPLLEASGMTRAWLERLL